jgi:hypothetical protein
VFGFAYSGRPPQLYFIALSRRSTLRKEGHRGCGSSPEEVNYPSPSCTVDDHRSEPKILTLSIVLIQYCTSQHLRIYSSLLYNDRSKLGLPSAFWLSEILCISTRVDLLWRCIQPGFVMFEAILSQRRVPHLLVNRWAITPRLYVYPVYSKSMSWSLFSGVSVLISGFSPANHD